ncbi:MAG: glycerophosphodiester phosphodiesterase family protein [Terracidiphilus sp.]|nr:glycerophosphodiester phosphodiesterase family protein [Terracidiphilus sp.]
MNSFPAVAALLAAMTLLPAARPQKGPIYAIAHRGEHIHHAENSVAAIESAAAAGADYAELDVRTTKDGKLVLMHDKTVDRTTDGHGAVKDMTAEEIAHLAFKGYGGSVPTFDEALDAAKGKIRIYLDWKDATPEAIFQKLKDHGMLEHVVVYGDRDELHRLQKLAPGIRVMPEAGTLPDLQMSQAELKPTVVAFGEDDFKPEIVAQALKENEEIFVDRLWAQDTPELWQDVIDRGARGIQTNHPAELVEFLREKHLHP